MGGSLLSAYSIVTLTRLATCLFSWPGGCLVDGVASQDGSSPLAERRANNHGAGERGSECVCVRDRGGGDRERERVSEWGSE